jgi:hypothetical protein
MGEGLSMTDETLLRLSSCLRHAADVTRLTCNLLLTDISSCLRPQTPHLYLIVA